MKNCIDRLEKVAKYLQKEAEKNLRLAHMDEIWEIIGHISNINWVIGYLLAINESLPPSVQYSE